MRSLAAAALTAGLLAGGDPTPVAAMRHWLDAAAHGRMPGLCALDPQPGRCLAIWRRLTPAERRAALVHLRREVGPFTAGPIVLVGRPEPDVAVVAVTGPRPPGAYAIAFRRARSGWHEDQDSLVFFDWPLYRANKSRPIVVFQVAHLRGKIRRVRLWVDGRPLRILSTRRSRESTRFAAPASARLPRGEHVAVAFADVGGHTGAIAWRFRR